MRHWTDLLSELGAPSIRPLYLLGIGFLAIGRLESDVQAITVTSQDLQITASWWESWVDINHQQHSSIGSFNQSSSSDLQLSAAIQSAPYGWVQASTTVSSYALGMSAFAEAWGGPLPEGGLSLGSSMTSQAIATTGFSAGGPQLGLSLNTTAFYSYSSSEQDIALLLRDLTTSTTLLNLTRLDNAPHVQDHYNFDVDPSHQYELVLSGIIHAFDAKQVDMAMYVELSNERVPDGGRTLVWLGMALTGLYGTARWVHRQQKWAGII